MSANARGSPVEPLAAIGVGLMLVVPLFGEVSIGDIHATPTAYFVALAVVTAATVGCLAGRRASAGTTGSATLIVLATYLIVLPVLLSVGTRRSADPTIGAGRIAMAETFLSIAAIVCVALLPWSATRFLRALARVILAGYLLHLAEWVVSGFDVPFVGHAAHKNVAGGAALATLLLALLLRHPTTRAIPRREHRLFGFVAVLAALTTFLSGSRTSVLLAAVGTVGAVLIARRPRQRAAQTFCAVAGLACAGLIPILYVNLRRLPGFSVMDDQFTRLTGAGIYSGREDRWGTVLELSLERPLLGHGYHYEEVYSDKTLHSHNLVLATLFRSGMLGAAALLVCFGALFALVRRRSASAMPSLLLALVLVHQTFEVNLLMGGVPIGLALCAVIGAALAVSDATAGTEAAKPIDVARLGGPTTTPEWARERV